MERAYNGWAVLAGVAAVFLISASAAATAAPRLELRLLSGAPDRVSDGSALVELRGQGGARVTLGARDVTDAFHRADDGRMVARIVDLKPGPNLLQAKGGGRATAKLVLIDHPITGPIFSGPHQRPFLCETEENGLGPARDKDCTGKTVVTYYYKSTEAQPGGVPSTPPPSGSAPAPGTLSPGFKPYDPSSPRPSDIARTTTSEGKVVDYVVRREIGTINRAVYEIEFLHQPGTSLPTPWSAHGPGWNGRLVYTFGGSCFAGYWQGKLFAVGAPHEMFLARGYAIVGSTKNVFGNDCNDRISAETAMMVKEYFVKSFGQPIHTIGWGESGGSMQQHLLAQNFPGILDGIIPGRSFPDLVTTIPWAVDCALLKRVFDGMPGAWNDAQKGAVSGFSSWKTCGVWNSTFSPAWLQSGIADCPTLPAALVYDRVRNPRGARCSIYDNNVNLLGKDPTTGFARRPLDNVGVQYGLAAFDAGYISAEQFIALNEKIGGYGREGEFVARRMRADPAALRIAYAAGLVTGRGGLASVPIIDFRYYGDATGDLHDAIRSLAMRARLEKYEGTSGNQVMLLMPNVSSLGAARDPVYRAHAEDMLRQMDQWLDAIAADRSATPAAQKVVKDKPAALVDTCWLPDGRSISGSGVLGNSGRCREMFPVFGDPRIAAGAPITGDVLKCSLRPISPRDYAHSLSVSQIERLKAVFPSGVCDYSKPSIGQSALWRAFR